MKSCSRKILELFYNANHSGRIVKPDAIGRVGENDEGLVIELSWKVANEVIVDAKFRAFGNPNAIAITSLVTDKLIGKTVSEALDIGESVLLDELDELRPEYIEVFDVVKLAIENTYANYLKHQDRKTAQSVDSNLYEPAEDSVVEVEPEGEQTELQIQKYIENSIFTTTTKAGRGRPRKIVEQSETVETGEKRGRGRPRKPIDETAIENTAEKRGRGRPRKIVAETAVEEVGEKRGRGRPRKPVDENAIVEIGEKRGRGRPRKPIDPNQVVEVGEKRGRGRPRKPVDESEIVEVGEKRGRGRPRKIVEESETVEIGEKRGRGRPRKENDATPSLSPAVKDEKPAFGRLKIETLSTSQTQANEEKNKFVEKLINNNVLVDDEDFGNDYDLFKSNIRNIFTGQASRVTTSENEEETNELQDFTRVDNAKQVENKPSIEPIIDTVDDLYNPVEDEDEQEVDLFNHAEKEKDVAVFSSTETAENVEAKRGRGRPRKIVDETVTIEAGEKRGRGRPRKPIDETAIEDTTEKRGRGRPRKIVDESEIEEVGEKRGRGRPKKIVDDTAPVETMGEKRGRGRPRVNSLTRSLISNTGVSHLNNTQDIVFASKNVTTTNINLNITKTTTEHTEQIGEAPVTKYSMEQAKMEIPQPEIDVEDIDNEVDEDNNIIDTEEIDASNIKDEAPSGGIADLLKALLNDDDE